MEENINLMWSSVKSHLLNFIIKQVKNKDAAQDVIQDVFLKFYSKIDTLKNKDKVTSWIFQITRNSISDYYRKKKKHTTIEDLTQPQIAELSDVDESKEFALCVSAMLDTLPTKYKEALTLVEIEGNSQKELAELLGISYTGAKSRVQRGRIKLKELLLQCCTISTDVYGNVIEYQKKDCSINCK